MREFPCPVCNRLIDTVYQDSDGTVRLIHRKPFCGISNTDMLSAYVSACKPKLRYPKLDGAK